MKRVVPNWLLQVAWFIAGIFGTGAFWYYLSQKNLCLTLVSAGGAVLFAGLAVALHVLSDAESTPGSAVGEDPRERRRAQVQKWREAVNELDDGFRDEERLKKFLSSSVYSTMRPNLPPPRSP